MSFHEPIEPSCDSCEQTPAVSLRLATKSKDVGGFAVRRALPSRLCRSVGPFVFFDEMGPAPFEVGQGMDVRPHPHINLATITYLFTGAIGHRDSLGNDLAIEPGALNLMVAGKGIVHSERTPEAMRAEASSMHGIQLWIALPEEHEETEPAFYHHPAASMPEFEHGGARLRVLVGEAYGHQSPVQTFSPMLYVAASLPAGTKWTLPSLHSERAAYIVSGDVSCGPERVDKPEMLVLQKDADATLEAHADSEVIFIAGEPLGRRYMWWNFVSSRQERIEQAKRDWKEGLFATVPGDETEFTPLPE